MRRLLKKVELPAGMPYAILTAGLAPQPDKKTGRAPAEQEMARWQRVRPVMNEILPGKGTCRGRGGQILVTGLKGPLEQGWQQTAEAFAARIPLQG